MEAKRERMALGPKRNVPFAALNHDNKELEIIENLTIIVES